MSNPNEKKGRGISNNPKNKFEINNYDKSDFDGLDDHPSDKIQTQTFFQNVKTAINEVKSPDVPMNWSINPYQGCEHGCSYCYARNSHEYWGFNAGYDFESKIVVKKNIVEAFTSQISKRSWKPETIMLSGNTDCYQPIEQKHKLTRNLLKSFSSFKHPVGIITKNSLITRDLDILSGLAKENLVYVNISINTLNEDLRSNMEPRTSTVKNRLKAIEQLAQNGIYVNVLIAPIILGLNDHELPQIIKDISDHGAKNAEYIMLRLNGILGELFNSWVKKHYPDRANKVINQIKSSHAGTLNENRFGIRMKGEGHYAQMVQSIFQIQHHKYFKNSPIPILTTEKFIRPSENQLGLF